MSAALVTSSHNNPLTSTTTPARLISQRQSPHIPKIIICPEKSYIIRDSHSRLIIPLNFTIQTPHLRNFRHIPPVENFPKDLPLFCQNIPQHLNSFSLGQR